MLPFPCKINKEIDEQRLSHGKTSIKNKPNAFIALGLSTF